MDIKQGIENGIVFFNNSSLDELLKVVFPIHYNEDETTFDNTEFTPIDIRLFSKEDYDLYDKEDAVIPDGVDNPQMFVFRAKNGNIYLGCFNKDKNEPNN